MIKFDRRLVLTVIAPLFLLLATFFVTPGVSHALGGNGLRVSPVRSDLTIQPGQTQNLTIYVTNVTTQAATLQGIVNDFTANPNETGDPLLILGQNKYAPSHSLKRYVKPIADFTLQPGQEKPIVVTISIPLNAPGGGYYGVVRFGPASSGGPNQTVSLSGSVGSLVIVTVPGNIVEKMSVDSFDVRKNNNPSSFFTSNKNLDVVTRFQNEGNIQEEPFGKVLLLDHSGNTLAEYEVNAVSPPGNVLPNSIREFPIPLTKVGSFGIYKLEGNFGYGTSGQLLSTSTTFYVVPIAIVLLFIAVVIILLFLIFGLPRMIKAYNERILSQAGRKRS